MGGQLTKEQARLPFGYVPKSIHHQRQCISGLNPSTLRSNIHSSPDNPETLFNDIGDFNNNNTPMSSRPISITPTGETASILTETTDTISPEVIMDVDKPEDDNSCCQGTIPDEGNLCPVVFSELQNFKNIGLCRRGLVKLSPNICFLYVTTCLQICCNELTEIPAEIGYMKNLTTLDVSKNRLDFIPDTIGFLYKLQELKLSNNQLTLIPSSVGSLKKLGTLLLDDNKIIELPPEIGQIKTLVHLDVRDNPLTVLPAELGRLQQLRKLRTDGCPLKTEFVHQLTHSPPTLMELAARTIVRLQVPILEDTTDHIKDYLASAKKCSFCGGPYFESYTKRGKIIDKNEQHIPLEYRLCYPHWNTEQERVSLLFCALPDTAPSPEPYKHRRNTDKSCDGNSVVSVSSSTHEKVQRPSVRRSMTIPLSSLTRSPSLPSLPRSASPRPTDDRLQDEVDIKKSNSSRGRNGGVPILWRSKKNNASSAILGKSLRNQSRLSSRWRT
ncbi:L domain-like protein [Gigaspora margarita]|uniref:L domain-like protein n=1 Tax=Gigaspora margarita TaxID=4874 RepID=A0A8H3X5J8_GIGMA|nr:L domain-like protein [Gigaspora margarita]